MTAIETAARAETTTTRTRGSSNQATVIGTLKRPVGATIQQIIEVTNWQAHTVCGTFAGAFKNKRGLSITSTINQGAERVGLQDRRLKPADPAVPLPISG